MAQVYPVITSGVEDVGPEYIGVGGIPPSAEATTSCMQIMFANQDLPDVVVSDNGPAFTSELYSTFFKKNGVRRMLVPPYHPASNGAAERAVQTVKNKFRKAGPGDIRTQIARMLLTYRSTPHEVTGCCPSELFGAEPEDCVGPATPRPQD
ncbi:uncharacterized protein K02A2.6-like [Rhipicephalus sanguineus]|uniref:uncharacterized protein K02A2.6-like n=1 Tax=Rhipicephalus sanguineus TaxID=34632 RepID=UPI00189552C0|nr:uncharacterized protein K02A2.6-like [Rhipicephalus sanguineus]